jgi:hypothetical protein
VHEARPDALRLHLWPKQWVAFLTEATELLFGGAAGPGKIAPDAGRRDPVVLGISRASGLSVPAHPRGPLQEPSGRPERPAGAAGDLDFAGWCRYQAMKSGSGTDQDLPLPLQDRERRLQVPGRGNPRPAHRRADALHREDVPFLRGRVRMVGIILPPQYRGLNSRASCAAPTPATSGISGSRTPSSQAASRSIRRMPPSEGGMLRQFIPGGSKTIRA